MRLWVVVGGLGEANKANSPHEARYDRVPRHPHPRPRAVSGARRGHALLEELEELEAAAPDGHADVPVPSDAIFEGPYRSVERALVGLKGRGGDKQCRWLCDVE